MRSKKKLILLLVPIAVLVILLFWAVYTYKQRQDYENKTDNELTVGYSEQSEIPLESSNQDENEEETGEFLKDEDKFEKDEEETRDKNKKENGIKESYLDIRKSDCEDKCKKYQKDKEQLRYCQEICGLLEISPKDTISACEDLEGLDEDYCLRDVAIQKMDFNICDKIEDAGILKMCHNRITEKLLERNKNL